MIIKILAVILPFPFGTVFSAVQLERENKVLVQGLRMTPAELLASTRRKRDE